MKPLHYAVLFGCLAAAPSVSADQVFNDDVIVDGNLCAGAACLDGESFTGLVDLKIKDITPRLDFEDTSPSGVSVTDWRVGTAGYFFVYDVDGGGTPLRIDAGAPTAAFMINDDGEIGLGTNFPQQEIHISKANTPTIRLEQNSSGGFPAQIWDIFANHGNFIIRDISDNRTPFSIFDGAPTNSLRISSNGNIGMGDSTPDAPLHVTRSTGGPTDMMRLENNGGVVFRLVDTSPGGQQFTFQSNGGIFRIASPAVPGPEFTMDDFGNVTITGEITTAGSCNAGCDRVFDEDYALLSIQDHAQEMWENKHLPNVGPTAEDGPMNLSEKVGGMLNELEYAHIYIAQQQELIDRQQAEIASMQEQLSDLAQLKQQVAQLSQVLQGD